MWQGHPARWQPQSNLEVWEDWSRLAMKHTAGLTLDSAFSVCFLPFSLFPARPAWGYFCFLLVQLPEKPCGFNWPIFCRLQRLLSPCLALPHRPWGQVKLIMERKWTETREGKRKREESREGQRQKEWEPWRDKDRSTKLR